MIDTRTRERLEYDMEEALRGYYKVKAKIAQIKEETINAVRGDISGLDLTEILGEMDKKLQDCETDMDIWKSQLTQAKKEYIKLIENVNFPEY